jgi:hypothetical protein
MPEKSLTRSPQIAKIAQKLRSRRWGGGESCRVQRYCRDEFILNGMSSLTARPFCRCEKGAERSTKQSLPASGEKDCFGRFEETPGPECLRDVS